MNGKDPLRWLAVVPVYLQQWYRSLLPKIYFKRKFLKSERDINLATWTSFALSALQVLYLSGNMAATKQIIGESLLKRKTTVNKPASPNTPAECGAPALFSSTVGLYTAQFKVCTNWTCRPLSPLWQECLDACSPQKPPIPLFWGTIPQCHVCAVVGGGRGVGGGIDICSWQLPRGELTCCDTMNGH